MTELDLEKGDEAAANRITAMKEKAATGGEKKPLSAQGGRRKSGGTARERVASNEIHSRVSRVLGKIADMMEVKEDEELATAIRENTDEMTQGFVSLTKNVTWLRNPLIMVLNLVEPTIAFWRVGTIVAGRWYERRQQVLWERQQQAGAVNNEQPTPQPIQ